MGGCAGKSEGGSNVKSTHDSGAPVQNRESTSNNEVKSPPKAAPQSGSTPASTSNSNGDELEGTRNEPIGNVYELGKEIGRGGFSIVVEGICKKTGEKCAIKCIKKRWSKVKILNYYDVKFKS